MHQPLGHSSHLETAVSWTAVSKTANCSIKLVVDCAVRCEEICCGCLLGGVVQKGVAAAPAVALT